MSKTERIIKAFRALLAVIVGCVIVIPFLFVVAIVLIFAGMIERFFFDTNYTMKIAKYCGDDGAELLKMISGTK